MHIKKNDTIIVISGNYKGKTGKVLKVFTSGNKVIVEKINMVKRHVKPGGKYGKGGIIQKEAPINASKMMLLCTKCNKPTRIAVKFLAEGKTRVCKKCGEMI
ncbi:MAG: 50S ribosomal protein L24 [Candidatus Firestonebacteria bacterium]